VSASFFLKILWWDSNLDAAPEVDVITPVRQGQGGDLLSASSSPFFKLFFLVHRFVDQDELITS
jgi:hypothetical protein